MEKPLLADEAKSLLLSQFANSVNIKALLHSLVQPFQEALNAIETLKVSLFIDSASGEVLDTIGAIVDEPRRNMIDMDYRPWLKVRILLNNNSGTTGDIVRILTILYDGQGEFELQESPGLLKVYLARPPAFTNEWVIQSILKKAVPLGTKVQIQIGFSKPRSER